MNTEKLSNEAQKTALNKGAVSSSFNKIYTQQIKQSV